MSWVIKWKREARRALPGREASCARSEALSRVGWVSRQALIDSRFSTIICAPVCSMRHGLATQVDVGLNEGLRHDSSVHCDQLVSLQTSQLTQFFGSLDATKLKCLDDALMVALGLLRS